MSKVNPCDGTCNTYLSQLSVLERAVKKLLDTLPSDPDGYYGHWDAGPEDTEKAIKAIRKLIKYPDPNHKGLELEDE